MPVSVVPIEHDGVVHGVVHNTSGAETFATRTVCNVPLWCFDWCFVKVRVEQSRSRQIDCMACITGTGLESTG